MKEPQANQEKLGAKCLLNSVKAAFQDPKMQLAAPLTLFIGLEQGFIYSDFTKVIFFYSQSFLNFNYTQWLDT